jgi:hypothetical protein
MLQVKLGANAGRYGQQQGSGCELEYAAHYFAEADLFRVSRISTFTRKNMTNPVIASGTMAAP